MGIRTHPLILSETDYHGEWFGLRNIDVSWAVFGIWRAGYTIPEADVPSKDLDNNLRSAKPIEGRSSVCQRHEGPKDVSIVNKGRK
jgi:hypothetical protein